MKKVLFSCLVILFCFSIVLITGCGSDAGSATGTITLRLINETGSAISGILINTSKSDNSEWRRIPYWTGISLHSEVTLTYDTNESFEPTTMRITFTQRPNLLVENIYLIPGKTTTLTIHEEVDESEEVLVGTYIITYTLVNP